MSLRRKPKPATPASARHAHHLWPALLCITLAALLTAPNAPAQNPTPLTQTTLPLGQDLYLRSGATGLVLVVVRDRESTIQTFGETYPNSHQRPTPDSLLRLCSLTKLFTADLLVQLAQAGTLRLDTPLQTLAPTGVRVPTGPPGPTGFSAQPITLGDLATHTSGLPRELTPVPPNLPHFTFPDAATRWARLPTYTLRANPGSSALYSNLAFDFLGDALAQAARTSYPHLLARRLTTPLHLSETTFTPTPTQCARLLLGAHPEGPCTSTVQTAGSSGLYSTPADMARYLQYLLGTGASAHPPIPTQDPAAQAVYLLPANLRSVRGLDHAGDPTGIGLAWIHTAAPDHTDIIQKTGGGAGFSTYIALLPSRHLALFLAATEGPLDTHFRLFLEANNVLLTLAGLPTLEIPPYVPPPPPRARHTSRRQSKRSTPHRPHLR